MTRTIAEEESSVLRPQKFVMGMSRKLGNLNRGDGRQWRRLD